MNRNISKALISCLKLENSVKPNLLNAALVTEPENKGMLKKNTSNLRFFRNRMQCCQLEWQVEKVPSAVYGILLY